MKKRDRGQTPSSTSLAGWNEAISREIIEVKPDTASATKKVNRSTTSAKSILDGEGTSGDIEKGSKSKDTVRIITNKKISIKKKNNYRVPVLYPDRKPGMPTSNKKANKLLEEGKAEIIKNKLNVFAIRLKFWPIYRDTQPIILLIDPGSTFTGIAVMSKKCINISYMLELPGYKKDSKPYIIEKKLERVGKNNGKVVQIQKYHNTIVERMSKRSQLRRGRRHRKCRRRECRFLNRSRKGKLVPSMLAKKQLELEITKQLSKLYPIQIIGFEDVSFNHYKDKDGTKGQLFSQVEIGKNWLLERLKNIPNIDINIPNIDIKFIKGYETNYKRLQLKLPKEENKTKRSVKSHVTDCIAMGSIILNTIIYPNNKFHFDVISRPKYSRRILFAEQPGKGGIFERYGGHIPNLPIFKGLRKGDYVECRAPNLKKIFRGWISGYTGDNIYTSDFDWNQSQAFSCHNVKLIDRNHGLINLRLSYIKDLIDICNLGTRQSGIEGNMIKIKKEKVKIEKLDNSAQRRIDDAW